MQSSMPLTSLISMNNLFLFLYDVVQLRTKVLFGIVVILRESILAMVEKELAVIYFFFFFSNFPNIWPSTFYLLVNKSDWYHLKFIFTFTMTWNKVEKYFTKFKRWKWKLFWNMNKLSYIHFKMRKAANPRHCRYLGR